MIAAVLFKRANLNLNNQDIHLNIVGGFKITEPENDYTIDQLQVSADGSNLYFTDKASQALHMIKLK